MLEITLACTLGVKFPPESRIRGQITPRVPTRHSSFRKTSTRKKLNGLVPSPLRGRGAFGAVLRASRAIQTRLSVPDWGVALPIDRCIKDIVITQLYHGLFNFCYFFICLQVSSRDNQYGIILSYYLRSEHGAWRSCCFIYSP